MTTASDALQQNLSAAQMGIWLGQQLNPHSPMYNAAEFIELRGELDVVLFTQAVRQVMSETIALNIIFEQTHVGPVQKFKAPQWQLIEQDFSQSATPKQQAREWMLAELTSTVNLASDALFAQALLKLGDQHYYWYQRIHHIASDGYSFALLTQTVAEHYSYLINGSTCNDFPSSNAGAKTAQGDRHSNHQINSHKYELPDNNFGNNLPLAKAIRAFNKVLEEDHFYHQATAHKKDQQFWANYLANGRAPVSLSRSLAPMADFAVRLSATIDKHTFSKIKTAASRFAVNWSDLLIAAVAQIIYQNTAACEITLGIPVMGRMGSAALRVPAMVMNIIPLRIKFSTDISLAQLAGDIAQQLKTSRLHSRYRYEQLKRDLIKTSPVAFAGEQRLFGAVVNIMPFDRQLQFANCSAQLHNLSAGPVEDISFSFVLNQDGSLQSDLDANPNRYRENELAAIQSELLFILQSIENGGQPFKLNVEKLSWLEGAGFTQHDTSCINPRTSVIASIYQQIQTSPNAIALQIDHCEISYGELGQKVSQCAEVLSATGLSRNAVIALALPRSESAIVTALATLAIGSTFLFIDIQAPLARNKLILADAQPALLVCSPDFALSDDVFLDEHNIHQLFIADFCSMGAVSDWQKNWQLMVNNTAAAYLIYTSGSTGIPKGVVISHRALADFVASTDDAYGVVFSDRVLQFAPLFFDACIEEIFVTLARGARLVLRNDIMLESIPHFIAQCQAWQISILDLPTAFWHELAFACTHNRIELPSTLRTIIVGGEAVLPERVTQWRELYGNQIALLNTYGPSEATVIATYANLTQTNFTQTKDSKTNSGISIGQPLSGRAIAVVDSELHILPKGESGELLLLGGGLGDGYWHLPEKTAESFIQLHLPFFIHAQRAYRTGDRVKINSENHIEFIGRLDDQIKISGYRIDPLEIEAALIALQAVQEAAVTVMAHANGVKYLVAHLVGNNTFDIASLRAALKDKLPAPMLPSRLVMHQQLPKNSSGKIDRKLLLGIPEVASPLRNTTSMSSGQHIILTVWQDILGQQNIQPDDDFFLLGGSSLQTIQLANRLAINLKCDVPVTLIFQNPTIASLSKTLFADNQEMDNRAIYTKTELIPHNNQNVLLADCLEFERELIINSRPHKTNMYHNILLTGATGFVGAQLLHQLLVQTSATIICSVRAPDQNSAITRIKKSLEQQGLFCRDLHRIKILLADLAQPALGLTPIEYAELANTIDVVFHNAAVTSVMRDYQSLRAPNALSTAELLKLAAIKTVPFHLVSTIAVAPPIHITAVLPEDFVPIHDGLQDGYQQSKWAAEQMVAIAQQKNYLTNVYRLARVTGSVLSGYVNPKDLVWSIIQTGLRTGVLPDLPISEPWTPVDTITRFIVADALANPGQGVCNVTPPHNLQLTQIYQWLSNYGFNFEILPIADWCEKVKCNSQVTGSLEDQAIVGFFSQRTITQKKNHPVDSRPQFSMATISNLKTTKKMSALGLRLPEITQELFACYLRYAINTGLLNKPTEAHTPTSAVQHVNITEVMS